MSKSNRKWQRAGSFVVPLLLGVLLIACAQSAGSGQQTAPAASTGAAKPTGEFTYVDRDLGQERWDPSLSAPLLSLGGGPIYETLFLHWPGKADVRPFLLESGKMADDAMSWTLKLKNGIRFSNGDPMTADDVKFSLDRFRSDVSVTSSAAQLRKSIKDVQVVDPGTVRVGLNEPLINLDVLLAGDVGNDGIVLPKKYIEQIGWEQFNQKPIGSGPYRMTEHKTGESVTFEAVENHWRATPRFSKVRYLMVPEERTRISMLRAGQADLVRIGAENRKEIEQAGFKSLVVPYEASWRVQFWGAYGDYPDHPLKRLEVRKALNISINRQEMLDALYAGAGEVAAYAHSIPGYTLGAPKLPVPAFDQAEARRLLQQAGYPSGFELTIDALNVGCSMEETTRFAVALAGYWEKIGVKTKVVPSDYTTYRPKTTGTRHTPDIVGHASTICTGGSFLASRDLSAFWWSKGGFKLSDAADAEIEKANAAKSQDEMVRWVEAAYRKLYDAQANIGVFHGGTLFAGNQKAADLPVTPGFPNLGMWLVYDKP